VDVISGIPTEQVRKKVNRIEINRRSTLGTHKMQYIRSYKKNVAFTDFYGAFIDAKIRLSTCDDQKFKFTVPVPADTLGNTGIGNYIVNLKWKQYISVGLFFFEKRIVQVHASSYI
jgi:hypothetical protein